MPGTDAALPTLAVHPLVVEQLNDLILVLRSSGALPISTSNAHAGRDRRSSSRDPPSPDLPEAQELREENASLQRELEECKIEIGRSRRALEGRARLAGRGRTEVGGATREQLNKVDAQRRAVDLLKHKDETMAAMLVEKDRTISKLEEEVRALREALSRGGLVAPRLDDDDDNEVELEAAAEHGTEGGLLADVDAPLLDGDDADQARGATGSNP
ncbi:hypothetical protein T484DRAFT_1927663 [Baffinella frigidus]|nr:hypothetical protein T484DRAFT_1927663 [Cryptophyta sp. CCMP2293]